MNRLGNYFSDTAYQEINELKTPVGEYFHGEFENEASREFYLFKLRNFSNERCKQQIEELKTDSKNGFMFKVKRTGIKN